MRDLVILVSIGFRCAGHPDLQFPTDGLRQPVDPRRRWRHDPEIQHMAIVKDVRQFVS